MSRPRGEYHRYQVLWYNLYFLTMWDDDLYRSPFLFLSTGPASKPDNTQQKTDAAMTLTTKLSFTTVSELTHNLLFVHKIFNPSKSAR